MKAIKIPRDTLLRPLQAVSGILERRTTLPILGHVLLNFGAQRLVVVATDLQLQMTQGAVLAGDSGAWAVTVPGRKLLEILRALPDGEIELSRVGERLVLSSADSRFSLQTLALESFPRLAPAAAFDARLVLSQGVFRRLLASVHFAMAQQDFRYFMNGLQLLVEDAELSVVALDGHRLASATLATGLALSRHELILPRKTVLELLRLLDDSDLPLEIALARDQARFVFGEVELLSKLIDARFPDARRAIPKPQGHQLTIAREPWLKALQRAAILSPEKFRNVRFLIEPGQMKMVSNNAEHDEAEERLAVGYQGAALEISFNAAYLLDALTYLEADSINLGLDPVNLSALLTIPGNDRYQYVAMALRH